MMMHLIQAGLKKLKAKQLLAAIHKATDVATVTTETSSSGYHPELKVVAYLSVMTSVECHRVAVQYLRSACLT